MTAKTEKSELTFAAIVSAALDIAAAQELESLSLGQLPNLSRYLVLF